MKSRFLVSLVLLLANAASAFAQVTAPHTPVIITRPPTCVSTVTLGNAPVIAITGTIAPGPSFPIAAGTTLRFVLDTGSLAHPVVTWYKDGARLEANGPTLELAVASSKDTGNYSALASEAGGGSSETIMGSAAVTIVEATPRLQNMSSRGWVGPGHPAMIGGIVIEPNPGGTLVLIRAVGPALAAFAVSEPLPDPTLRVFDASGHEVTPFEDLAIFNPTLSNLLADNAGRVGAFPLPPDGKNVSRLYLLHSGAYTAHVTSAGGSSGNVLLEVYQVPVTP